MSKKKVGLTLSGGGAKGAYQIGVWRALRETGLDTYITSVSGTSVGGINAALFIQGDLEKAEEVWRNISRDVILTPKSPLNTVTDTLSFIEVLERVSSRIYFDLKDPVRMATDIIPLLENGQIANFINRNSSSLSFFTRDGLVKLIDKYLDMDRFYQDPRSCWLTCTRIGKSDNEYITADYSKYVTANVDYFNLKHKDRETVKKIILATSALLILFPPEEVEGERYVDGGIPFLGGDDVPVAPLCVVDKCDIVLGIHLSPMDKPIVRRDFEGTKIYEIFPQQSLGSMLDFNPKCAEEKMELGYRETINLFRKIKMAIDFNQGLIDNMELALLNQKAASDRLDNLKRENVELMRKIERD